MTTPFILLATQRTGSSWVQEMLNSHRDLKVYSELFLREARGYPMWEPKDVVFANTFWEEQAGRLGRLDRVRQTGPYLRYVFQQPGSRAVGFKYMYDQVPRSPAVLPYAALHKVAVIHLIRRNMLDSLLSAEAARRTGMYHKPGDGRPPIPWQPVDAETPRLRLEPDRLLADLRRLRRERQVVQGWLRATRTRHLEVAYEDLTADPLRFGAILRFLGVPEAEATGLTSGLEKVRTVSYEDTIENLVAVRAALVGTPFETFLASA